MPLLTCLVFALLTACSQSASDAPIEDPESSPEKDVGFEVLQIVSPNEIIVWLGLELTQEDFDAIELPQGWFKNEPRETDPDRGSFARSPDASEDGEFTDEEHFGHLWRHNATVIEAGTPVDEEELLQLNRVAKFHEVGFDAGRALIVLVSPEDKSYVRISRDSGRTAEEPTIPNGWQILEYVTPNELIFQLPNPTENIRADNEDSFQGPLDESVLGSLQAGD
jgi:hypothetical protein